MTRTPSLKKRIVLLVRYTQILLATIFSDRNAVALYISSMLFALVSLGMYAVVTAIQESLGIPDTSWRSVILLACFLIFAELIASLLRGTPTQSTLRRPNYPISRDSIEITRQLTTRYLSSKHISLLMRLKAAVAIVVVICVSLIGVLEQQMLRTMGSIASRISKSPAQNAIKLVSHRKF